MIFAFHQQEVRLIPGIVPVTLVDSRAKRSVVSGRQAATHAEYSGMVEFHNVFDGELPAAEYPKINVCRLLFIGPCTALP